MSRHQALMATVVTLFFLDVAVQAQEMSEPPPSGLVRKQFELEMLEKQMENYLEEGGKPGDAQYEKLFETITSRKHELLRLEYELAREQQQGAAAELEAALSDQKKTLDKVRQNQLQELVQAMKTAEQNYIQKYQEHVKKVQSLEEALHEAHEELERQRKETPEAASDDGIMRFKFKYVDAREIEQRIHQLLDDQPIRFAVGPSPDSLIVRADEKTLKRITKLIEGMDQPVQEKQESVPELPSVSVKLLLLTEGDVSSNAAHASEVLPESVIDGLQQIGLKDPHVVMLNTTTVAPESSTSNHFEMSQPGAIFDEWFRLNAVGEMKVLQKGNLQLKLHAALECKRRLGAQVQFVNECEIAGSLLIPIGHYTVLGTGNYLSGISYSKNTLSDASSAPIAYVVQVIEAESYGSTTAEQELQK